MFDQANAFRFTRNGVPTPVNPDFTNLQRQWATLTASGIASNEYVAKMETTPPPCPSFTADGWNVVSDAPLPTIGAEGVQSGMPSGVPTGSITVSVNTNVTSAPSAPGAPAASTSLTYHSAGSPTSSEGASSATSEGAAGKTSTVPVSISDVGFMGMVVALIAVGAGVMILL